MAAVAYLGLKGNIKDVVAKLKSMTEEEAGPLTPLDKKGRING